MKKYLLAVGIGLLWMSSAQAAPASLKISPLKYQEVLNGPEPKIGIIDVSNPTDSPLSLTVSLEGVRQMNEHGDLEFFRDTTLESAVSLGSDKIELEPREAVRMPFKIDPRRLPPGGVYGAIFFESSSAIGDATGSIIHQQIRIGTLLLLTNSGAHPKQGTIQTTRFSALQLGKGISGQITYRNTASGSGAIAFNPSIDLQSFPLGSKFHTDGPLVFPSNQRIFTVQHPGNYFGPLPLHLTDRITGHRTTIWVIAMTGYWRWLIPLLLITFLIIGIFRYRKRI